LTSTLQPTLTQAHLLAEGDMAKYGSKQQAVTAWTVRCSFFRQRFALEDAIGSHACSHEALTMNPGTPCCTD
jgi:hypothetical protein